MGMLGGTTQVDGLTSGDVATAVDHLHLGALEWKKEIVRMNLKDGNVVHGDIEVVDSVRSPFQTTESGCREIVNYLKENDKVEPAWTYHVHALSGTATLLVYSNICHFISAVNIRILEGGSTVQV